LLTVADEDEQLVQVIEQLLTTDGALGSVCAELKTVSATSYKCRKRTDCSKLINQTRPQTNPTNAQLNQTSAATNPTISQMNHANLQMTNAGAQS
jgi:hypothetical protein